MIKKFRRWRTLKPLRTDFAEAFGQPFPNWMVENTDVVEIVPDRGGGYLVGDAHARARPVLVGGDLTDFVNAAPVGYLMVGLWGHGVNSHAYYYSHVEAAGRVWLRLPFGGVYMDNDDNAAAIPDFFTRLYEFLHILRDRRMRYLITHHFSSGEIHIETADGRTAEHHGTFLYYPEFERYFAELL